MPAIRLPSNASSPDGLWHPRKHQQQGWDYLMGGGKRLVDCSHRRAGKDELALAWTAVAAHNRVANYWHLLPLQVQARKAIWTAVDPHRGVKRIDLAFPMETRARTLDQEMQIFFKNGSTWSCLGSDNFDSLVGTTPAGIVYSEYALSNPASWSYLRPILAENNGWATFISTPRGRNHFYKLWKFGQDPDNDWLSMFHKADETDVFTPEQLESERLEYIGQYGEVLGQAMYLQEYQCSWASAIPGAYWAKELDALEQAGRLTEVPHDPALPVHTSHDLGIDDESVTFYFQLVGPQWRMIDVDVYRGVGLVEQVKDMHAKPYTYGDNAYPHDLKVRDLGSGVSRERLIKKLGIQPHICPMHKLHDGIDAVRRMIPMLWIDREKCGDAFETLKSYRAEYDENKQTLRKQPLHDYTSNWADSLRYRAMTPVHAGEWTPIDYSEAHRAMGW